MTRKIINTKIALFYFLFVFCLIVIPSQAQEPTISIDATVVNVPVVVSDSQGRYITGLKQEDFLLYDNQVQQQIAFFDAAEEPLNVALLLDTSQSTREVLEDIKEAAFDFLLQLRSKDRAMVITFDDRVRFLTPLTSDQSVLERAIYQARIGDRIGTRLNDAVIEASQELKKAVGRKAIILLTDGKDYGSDIDTDELLDKVMESNSLIYTIFYPTGRNFSSPINKPPWRENPFPKSPRMEPFPRFPRFPRVSRLVPQAGRRVDQNRGQRRNERIQRRNQTAIDFLTELAEVTAGRFYKSEVTDLKKTFRLIAEELRNQYILGFYPDNSDFTDTPHSIKVQVSRKDVVVRSRRNYRLLPPNSNND
ncbi:MAG: VWA domain-containing protein [Blastocatellia bacterium]|nr:VWA domain-containing protein [Blastocatellia bacterium]